MRTAAFEALWHRQTVYVKCSDIGLVVSPKRTEVWGLQFIPSAATENGGS